MSNVEIVPVVNTIVVAAGIIAGILIFLEFSVLLNSIH